MHIPSNGEWAIVGKFGNPISRLVGWVNQEDRNETTASQDDIMKVCPTGEIGTNVSRTDCEFVMV